MECANGCVSLFAFSCLFSLYLFCLIPMSLFVFYFIIPWKSVYFPVIDRKGVDPDGRRGGEDLGGEEGGKPQSGNSM